MTGSSLRAASDALARFEPEGAELRRKGVEGGAAESAEGERSGDIDHAGVAGHGGLGTGNAAGEIAFVERDGGALAGAAGGGEATQEWHRELEARSMSSMGRMPAMGSLANGKAMATAPTSLPSM